MSGLELHLYNLASSMGPADLRNGLVSWIAEDDEASIPRQELQNDAMHLVVHAVLSGHHDDWQRVVHESQRSMLHFSCQDALAVDECHLLDL